MKESVSLALLNTHYTINYPIPYLPNLIEIGGFHMKDKLEPLPEDIKEFIESAEHGVVYFSMGGNLKPSLMQPQKKKDIIAALSKIKQKILWKWDETNVSVNREKFLVRKYFPQDEILAHPNTKVFITHGGLLSCTESMIRGVPVIGIPIFGDQSLNMARAEKQGWGVQVKYTNLTEKALSWALEEVLSNRK
jgi:glucuronosyltransferase